MENSVTDKDINTDFLSQSYSQGIERITGTKDHIVNFQVPKEVLESRIKTWNNMFDKYSEEMSDDIEINIETLEPEEKEDEECSEEEYSCGQRVPMRKSATLVQYWVNTGNTPYKVFLDKKELSESGSSLNEEEITSPSFSLLSNKVNENSKDKRESDTSFSSVDTAAYILSNANVTKKADTIAIIEGAKSNDVKSPEDNCIEDANTVRNDRTNCMGTAASVATDHLIHNERRNDVSHNISHSISMENMASDTDNQLVTSTVISTNTAQPEVSSSNSLCNTIDKPDVLSASQKNVDLHNIDDIVTIFQQFNEASKRLSDDKSNDILGEDKALKERDFSEKQMSTSSIEEIVRRDANLTTFHRKKLYTGRNSPVDLILIKRDSSDVNKSKSSNTRLTSHPALDPDNSIRSESLVHKDKKRHFSSKKTLNSKKVQAKKGQKHSPISSKNITDDEKVTTNGSTQDSTVDSSSQNLSSFPDNADKRSSDNLIRHSNSINNNVSMKNVAQKYPIVYVERITLFKEKNPKSVTKKKSVHKDPVASEIHGYQIENLDSADSDQSTILICECNNNASQDSSSVSSSFHLRLSTEGESCMSTNAGGKDNKLTNLKNADMNQNKKAFVILERLPQSIIEKYTKATQVLSMNGDLPVNSEKLLNKSKMNSFNSRGTNVKNNVKLREIKVTLDRLPANTYLKGSSNAASTVTASSLAVKDKTSQITGMTNNKRKFKNTIRSSNSEAVRIKKRARTIHKINNNYSLRIRSKTNDDEINNTSDDAQRDNQVSVSNGTESNLTSRHGNHDSQVCQDKHRKFSVVGFISSDEDDLARLIRPSKKRLKMLIDGTSKTHVAEEEEEDLHDEATLISTNKNKYDSNRNISTIYSSKRGSLRKTDRLIRNRRPEAKVKSGSDATSRMNSFPVYKHKKFSFFPCRSDQCDNIIKNLNGRRVRYSFSTRNISNNNEKSKATKENETNRKNGTCVTLFQTKTFNTESSDSDKSNHDITFIRKSLRIASAHDKTRFNGHVNQELCDCFYTKTPTNKRSNSLNSPTKKYDAANKTHSTRKRSRSTTGRIAKANEQFDREFYNNINLRTNITTKTMPYLPVGSPTRNALMQKDKAILKPSLRNNGPNKLLRNRQISEKRNLKNSPANQSGDVKLSGKNLWTFQTKSYYDSDSSEH